MKNFKWIKDLTGEMFGKLRVNSIAITPINGQCTHWECYCECGNKKIIARTSLIRGLTTSCGCNNLAAIKKSNTFHGLSGTRIFKIWEAMRNRCNNPSMSQYKDYGGRGISICNDWKYTFLNFYEWGMKNGYSDDLTIDRIDNNGNYEPSNCRWATSKQQNRNRRGNNCVLDNGNMITVSEASEKYKINYPTLLYRINKMNLPLLEAIKFKR